MTLWQSFHKRGTKTLMIKKDYIELYQAKIFSVWKYEKCTYISHFIFYKLFYMIDIHYNIYLISLVAQSVKSLPAMWETWVLSLVWEDHLEKDMATHTVLLPEESHGQRSLVGYSPWDHKELDTTEWLTFTFTFTVYI